MHTDVTSNIIIAPLFLGRRLKITFNTNIHRHIFSNLHEYLYEVDVEKLFLRKSRGEISFYQFYCVPKRQSFMSIFLNEQWTYKQMYTKSHKMGRGISKASNTWGMAALLLFTKSVFRQLHAANRRALTQPAPLQIKPACNKNKIRTTFFSKTAQRYVKWTCCDQKGFSFL